jgi:hypothetical protein
MATKRKSDWEKLGLHHWAKARVEGWPDGMRPLVMTSRRKCPSCGGRRWITWWIGGCRWTRVAAPFHLGGSNCGTLLCPDYSSTCTDLPLCDGDYEPVVDIMGLVNEADGSWEYGNEYTDECVRCGIVIQLPKQS